MALLANNTMESERATAAVLATWRTIAAALSPVIGARGFTALYQRALRRVATELPWLDAALVRDDEDAFAALEHALAQRTAAEVAAAGDALRDTFRELLEHLIGAALARRLVGEHLPAAGTNARSGDDAA